MILMNLKKIQSYTKNKKLMFYFLMYFVCYLGLGSYFVVLSPHMIQLFGADAKYIFLSGQLGYPLGYFLVGWISDKTKQLKIYGIIFSLLLIPTQYFLFMPNLDFYWAILLSAIVRFLFAGYIQIIQIAALEELYYAGFSISRSAGTLGFFLMQIIMFLLEIFYFPSGLPLEIEGARGGQIGTSIHILTFIMSYITLPKKRKSDSPYFFREAIDLINKNHAEIFFVLSFFYYFSYQIVDFYLGAYFRNLGGMKFVYLSWMIAVLVEIPFFPLTQKIIHRFGLKMLFLISLSSGFLRFLLLYIHSTMIGGNWILFSQILHGLHFTGYMAGSVYFFHKKFPEHIYGTAYGLFMIFSLSLGSILGNLTYGTLLKYKGFSGLFILSFLIHYILFTIIITNKKIDKQFF
jgi:MFS family permease